MKVSDLKRQIADLPDDADLFFNMASGCCGDHETLEIWDTAPGTYNGKSWLVFYFNSLPGYRTCRQAGDTIREDEKYHVGRRK